MIAKRITRQRVKKPGKTDKGLFAYVVNEKGKGRGDPVEWKLADYITDAEHAGEKVERVRITNCEAIEVGWAVKEIMATQARNTRSQTDKSYHLVVSFPEGERPTPAQLIDIEDQMVAAIGLQDHQRISAVHINTDHYHLHVAINKVHPTSFRNIEPWYDHYRLQEMCQQLELKHGLHQDNHERAPDHHPAGRAADMEAQGRQTFQTWAREQAAEAIVEAARSGRSWQDMHAALAQFDIAIQPRGAGLVIVHRQDAKWRVKASDVARELSFKALTDRWGPYEPSAPLEVGGAEVPGHPVQPPALPPLQPQGPAPDSVQPTPVPTPTTTSVPPGPEQTVTAEPAWITVPPVPGKLSTYTPAPVQQGQQADSLWQRYQRERIAAAAARNQALAELRAGHARHGEETRAWYAKRIKDTKQATLSRSDKLDSYRHIHADRVRDLKVRIERERAERQQVRADHPVMSWQQFLEREAALGDVAALATLRAKAKKRLPVIQQIITAADHAEALAVIHANMKPFVGRNGTVIYSIGDGGSVADTERYVSVSQVTTGAITLALELSLQKFRSADLIVRGTPDFEDRVRQIAARAGLSVRVGKSVETDKIARHTVLVRTNAETDIDRNDRGRGD